MLIPILQKSFQKSSTLQNNFVKHIFDSLWLTHVSEASVLNYIGVSCHPKFTHPFDSKRDKLITKVINNNFVFIMVKQANYYDSWENVGGELIIFDLNKEKEAFSIPLKNTLIALNKVGSQLIGLSNSLSYTWDL